MLTLRRLSIVAVLTLAVFAVPVLLSAAPYAGKNKGNRILERSEKVLNDVMSDPVSRIPTRLFEECKAIAVFPGVLKGSLIIGGQFGEGVIISKSDKGSWKAPLFYTISGGSFGFQIGAKSMDVVFFFMNERGLKALIDEKLTIGGDLAVVAGTIGAMGDADIDILLQSEIVSYTRARGLFAGISVKGCVVAFSDNLTASYYDKSVSKRDVLFGDEKLSNTKQISALQKTIEKYSK